MILFIYSFIFGCGGSLLLCRFSSSCGKQQLLSNCGARASHCDGLPCCWARALGHVGFSSCGSGTWLFHGMWSGIKPMSPALAGGFFTTEPPGKPSFDFWYLNFICSCPFNHGTLRSSLLCRLWIGWSLPHSFLWLPLNFSSVGI